MFCAPMLLTKVPAAFYDTRYLWQPKIDGHRIEVCRIGGVVRLWTKQGNEVTQRYPELHDVPVDGDVVLDGEVCRANERGIFDLELINDRFLLKKADRILRASINEPVTVIVFDILYYRGRDLRGLPLVERQAILHAVLQPNRFYGHIVSLDADGPALYQTICDRSWEGVVGKLKGSRYVSRRSPSWVKVIRYETESVVLAGFRKADFGWLVHVEEAGRLRPAGTIESAPAEHRREFWRRARSHVSGEDKQYVYLEPVLHATVKFRNWTRGGMLRQPELVSFLA